MNTVEILPLIRNGSLKRGAYTVNIAPGAFSEILGNQVLVYTHGKPDSDILTFSAREFLSLIESARKLSEEQFRALVTEKYVSRQNIGQPSHSPAVQPQLFTETHFKAASLKEGLTEFVYQDGKPIQLKVKPFSLLYEVVPMDERCQTAGYCRHDLTAGGWCDYCPIFIGREHIGYCRARNPVNSQVTADCLVN